MTNGTHLTGLEGTNPLGFLAALGVQVLFDFEEQQPRLWWTNDVIPHAVVDPEFEVDRLVEQSFRVFPHWVESPALNPGFGTKTNDTAKFKRDDVRTYLDRTRAQKLGNRLASALVAEGSLDGAGKFSKPTDLYFTAGQLKFLKIARDVLSRVESDDVLEALKGPWSYTSKLSSLGWDTSDDRNYALAPMDPAKDKKLTNPGAEALAILGLSRHPVYVGRDKRGRGRTLTQGCAGAWRRGGSYAWPLWTRPATSSTVRSLLTHTAGEERGINHRSNWYGGWGVSWVMRSVIRRSDQGGYGTFGPPRIVWSANRDVPRDSRL